MPDLAGPEPDVWDALALRARNLFSTHAWAATWWESYGDGARPQVVVDDPARPRVVLPLCTRGRVLRQTRWIGHGPADLLGPVCDPADEPLAADLLARTLADRGLRSDVVLLEDCADRASWWAEAAPRTVRTETSPVLRLPAGATWEQWLAGKSRNFRSQVSRKPNGLRRDHEVDVRLATGETLEADLAALFELHAARWDRDSVLLDPRQRRFTEAFARVALDRGWLRLWTLDVDGRPAASALTYRFGDDVYLYQLGRDPGLERASVGFVLLVHLVRDAFATGAVEFRFLRGDEDYKSRFADGDDPVRTLALPRTLRGRAATAVAVRRRQRAAAAASAGE
ncbi:GNAT family N-acetyltransferase [Nocardioides litoris]|uniref:GNAT family N-acetyltransferase n=1 Tax=Nocardioides litoris TaxID=1926648 RepID=UPI001476D8B0|nr:GNAT family N-acetyltransferase [Nocardioides litoris]